MRALAADGATVVFVTHKLREALSFADRITVMRAGRIIRTVTPDEVDAASLTTMIVGESVVEAAQLSTTRGRVKVELADVCCVDQAGTATLRNLSFRVHAGEIYGIAGVGGNGQNDVTAVLTGLKRKTLGKVTIAGQDRAHDCTPRELRDLGVACIHSDRARYALANELGVVDNFSVSGVMRGRYGSFMNVNRRRACTDLAAALRDFDVRGVRSPSQKTGLLSGGNAQKLVIAREFANAPEVVVAHSPCRGLDVRAASAVHGPLRAARDRGAAIILISEDLDEILLMSDRIGVISQGRIVQEFDAPARRSEIGKAMVGHA
jgi:simple sugar transport system ATP-binding protein